MAKSKGKGVKDKRSAAWYSRTRLKAIAGLLHRSGTTKNRTPQYAMHKYNTKLNNRAANKRARAARKRNRTPKH